MSAIGQPAEGAPEQTAAPETAAPETQGPDMSAVMDRVGEIASGLGELQSGFQQFVQAQQPEPEPEQDAWDALFGVEPEPAPEPAAPTLDAAALQQAVQQAIAQQLGPVSQTVQQLQQQQQLAQLYRDVPQLADTPENAEVRQQTAEAVQAALDGAPPEIAAWLSNSPQFIQTVFKAAEADRLARAQEPAGAAQVLEGGGAHPGGTGQAQQSIVQQVMSNRVSLPKGFR